MNDLVQNTMIAVLLREEENWMSGSCLLEIMLFHRESVIFLSISLDRVLPEPGESVFHSEVWEIYTELVDDLVLPEIQKIIVAL